MPTYVYGCTSDKTHPRIQLTHGWDDMVVVKCGQCGATMARVPQPFKWGRQPFDTLLQGLKEKYERGTYRRSLSK